jgi:hypothetical protein
MSIWQILAATAALCGLASAETITFDGDSKEQSHWGYVVGIIVFILVLQAIGLGIEFWYKKKLNEFLAQTGQGQDVRTEE